MTHFGKGGEAGITGYNTGQILSGSLGNILEGLAKSDRDHVVKMAFNPTPKGRSQ
jgi:hypothetical protein